MPSLKLKVLPKLPAQVLAGDGIIIDQTGGAFTFSVDPDFIPALDSELTAIAGLPSAANKVPYYTGSGTAALADFSAFGRSLVDDANAAAGVATLGLGTPTGTGNVVLATSPTIATPTVDGPTRFQPASNVNNALIFNVGTSPGGGGATITSTFQDGTIGSPTTTGISEIFFIQSYAWDGASFTQAIPNAIVCVALETFSPTAHGAGWVIQSTSMGTTTGQNEICFVDGVTVLEANYTAPGLGRGTLNAKNGLYDNGDRVYSGNAAWTTYTPTATPGTGAFTTKTATGRYRQLGKTVFLQGKLVITAFGTAGAGLTISLPGGMTLAADVSLSGVNRTTQAALLVLGDSGTTTLYIARYDNTTVIGANNTLYWEGVIEVA